MSILVGFKPSIQRNAEKRNANSMTLRETTRDEFVAHITEDKADAFAKTFVAKADMQQQWQYCIGYWEGIGGAGTSRCDHHNSLKENPICFQSTVIAYICQTSPQRCWQEF